MLPMKYLGSLVLALSLLASAAATAQTVACPQFFPSGEPPALPNPKLSQRTTFLCNDAYAVVASGVTHGAPSTGRHVWIPATPPGSAR
jgi:endonuclease G